MGGPVELVEAPNGAIANKRILDGIEKVAWLDPTIEPSASAHVAPLQSRLKEHACEAGQADGGEDRAVGVVADTLEDLPDWRGFPASRDEECIILRLYTQRPLWVGCRLRGFE
jgi:hypothetical protein